MYEGEGKEGVGERGVVAAGASVDGGFFVQRLCCRQTPGILLDDTERRQRNGNGFLVVILTPEAFEEQGCRCVFVESVCVAELLDLLRQGVTQGRRVATRVGDGAHAVAIAFWRDGGT